VGRKKKTPPLKKLVTSSEKGKWPDRRAMRKGLEHCIMECTTLIDQERLHKLRQMVMWTRASTGFCERGTEETSIKQRTVQETSEGGHGLQRTVELMMMMEGDVE
jgi:hypothetical protein